MQILVTGCSMTAGHGLAAERNDPALWVNQLLGHHSVDNRAQTGNNNHTIFLDTAQALIGSHYDLVVVGWSAIPRWNINLGLELYPTRTMLKNMDIMLNPGVCVPGTWLEQTGNRLLRYHNDHWDILNLIKYINILLTLAADTKIIFVNTMGPWPSDYFSQQNVVLPSDLDTYTQHIIQAQTRDDTESLQLYNKIHHDYRAAGGIHREHWINLYNSLQTLQVDTVSATDHHPGYCSQSAFVEYLRPKLTEII